MILLKNAVTGKYEDYKDLQYENAIDISYLAKTCKTNPIPPPSPWPGCFCCNTSEIC